MKADNIIKILWIIVGAAFLAMLLTSCDDWRPFTTPKQEISGLFFHEYSRYSVAVTENNQVTIVQLPYHYGSVPIDIYVDVQEMESMWYKCTGEYNSWNAEVVGGCEIHIRSSDDIGAAGWNHGKFGSGQTVKIQ